MLCLLCNLKTCFINHNHYENKTIVLTILLTVGISFQSCERIDTGWGGPGSTLKYFDIKGLYLLNYKKNRTF